MQDRFQVSRLKSARIKLPAVTEVLVVSLSGGHFGFVSGLCISRSIALGKIVVQSIHVIVNLVSILLFRATHCVQYSSGGLAFESNESVSHLDEEDFRF